MENPKYKLRIFKDTNALCPFTDWDCEYPLMFQSQHGITDYSKGEIFNYVKNFLTDNQLIRNQFRIITLAGFEDDIKTIPKDEKIDMLRDLVGEYIEDGDFKNLENFCTEFKIPHYAGTSKGYSQGDWANVIVVPTDENAEKLGYDVKKIRKEALKSTFDLFGYWAWGDVYGFQIDERREFKKIYTNGDEVDDFEWEEVDSCWGFYGPPIQSGMVENINYESFGWTREELEKMLTNFEIE